LKTFGDIWKYLKTFGNIWKPLKYFETVGNVWKPLKYWKRLQNVYYIISFKRFAIVEPFDNVKRIEWNNIFFFGFLHSQSIILATRNRTFQT